MAPVDYTVTGRSGYGARQAGYGARQAAGYGTHRSAVHARDYRAERQGHRQVHRQAGWRNDAGRAAAGSGSYYVVRLGDTMWIISAQLGSTVHRLAAANGIANPDVISVGQRIHY